jgi:hypothetical protein
MAASSQALIEVQAGNGGKKKPKKGGKKATTFSLADFQDAINNIHTSSKAVFQGP